MCGRFTLIRLSDYTDLFPWIRGPGNPGPSRYNIAPTQPVAVVSNDGQNRIDFMRWGLVPSWAKDVSIGSRMINARSETLAEKPAFRVALKRRRCVIPASGFYEWRKHGNLHRSNNKRKVRPAVTPKPRCTSRSRTKGR